MTGTRLHPFQTPGAFQGEWLGELGFNSQPTFRYVAPEAVRSLLSDGIAQFAYPAAHGIVTLEEIERCDGEQFDTWKVDGIIQDEVANRRFDTREETEQSPSPIIGSRIRFIATRTGRSPEASMVIFEQLATEERRTGVIPVHDICVEGTMRVGELLRSLP